MTISKTYIGQALLCNTCLVLLGTMSESSHVSCESWLQNSRHCLKELQQQKNPHMMHADVGICGVYLHVTLTDTRPITELQLLLPTASSPHMWPPAIRSPRSHIFTDDVCGDSSVRVFHCKLKSNKLWLNSEENLNSAPRRRERSLFCLVFIKSDTPFCGVFISLWSKLTIVFRPLKRWRTFRDVQAWLNCFF